MNTLILGEAPGRFAGGLTRTRISEIAGRPYEEWADFRNLLDDYPGPGRGKGTAWNPATARAVAAEQKAAGAFEGYDRIVLLGGRVASAFIPGGAGFPNFRWTTVPGIDAQVAVIPHTSGIVRFWNDPANVELARRFLEPLALDPDREAGDADLQGEPARAAAEPNPVASEASPTRRPESDPTEVTQPKEAEMPTTQQRPAASRTRSGRRSSAKHPPDRDLVVAAFKAAGVPLTAKEAAAIVIETGLARPQTKGTPLDYRLSSPIYRMAKQEKVFRRVATEPLTTFEVGPDAPRPDADVVKTMKPIAKRIVAARQTEAAAA